MLNNIFGKSVFKSMTAWGLFIKGAVMAAEKSGFLPAGSGDSVGHASDSLVVFGDNIGDLLIVLGLRKAATDAKPL